MKTFQQFKEESDKFGVKKIMNDIKQNPNVQNLFKNMKGGNVNVNDMKKIVKDKKFINDTKNQSIDVLGKAGNMAINQITSTLKNLGK